MSTYTELKVLPPLSQTRYERMACPWLYVREYLDGVKGPSTLAARRGGEAHEVIAEYVRHLVKLYLPQDESWLARRLEDVWDEETREMLENFGHHLAIDPEKVYAAELLIELDDELKPCAGKSAPSYRGLLDLVTIEDEVTAAIYDWKSQYSIAGPESFQSRYYPFLLFCLNPNLETIHFSLRFLRYREAERSVTFTRDGDFPRLRAEAEASRIRQKAYHSGLEAPATPGSACVYCPFVTKDCPVKDTNPRAQMAYVERAQFGLWLAAAKKENDALLKEYCDANGPVRFADSNGNEFEAGFNPRDKRKFPLHKILPVLGNWQTQSGEDLKPRLTVSGLSSWIKAKKRVVLAEAAQLAAEIETSTWFGIRRAGEEEEESE